MNLGVEMKEIGQKQLLDKHEELYSPKLSNCCVNRGLKNINI